MSRRRSRSGICRWAKLVSNLPHKTRGGHPQLWEFIKQADIVNMPQALKDAFLSVNPDSQRLKTMQDKDAERLRDSRTCPPRQSASSAH